MRASRSASAGKLREVDVTIALNSKCFEIAEFSGLLYYPKFSEKITRLANQTPATLEIKLQWREEGGSVKEQVLRDDFVIYGVNEVQYSDLLASRARVYCCPSGG